jgi:D-ribose pyranase
MKDRGLLHPQLARVLAETGHGDLIGIADAGLPIPPAVERVDLALTRGVASFEDVARAVLEELRVEAIVLAQESRESCPHLVDLLTDLAPGAEVVWVTHTQLKERSGGARAIVRTGEFTPYANVLLVSGVDFG